MNESKFEFEGLDSPAETNLINLRHKG